MPTRDASSPVRVTTTGDGAGGESGTTASFSPPSDSWLFINFGINENNGTTPTFTTPTNTGTGLTWSNIGSTINASGGGVVIWRAYNANAQVGITVTCGVTADGTTLSGNSSGMWVDVWTGCAASQASAATPVSSTSTSQSNNPSITTTATGSRVALCGLDWGATGNPTSSDTIDGGTVAGQTSFGRAYKASDSGAAGSVSVNFQDGGASPINSFVIYEILAGAGGGDNTASAFYLQA